MYAVILKQKGDGCDYMIGCGMVMFLLQAHTLEEALKEAKIVVQGTPNDESNYGFDDDFLVDKESDEQSLAFAKLVKIECELPIADWYHEVIDKSYALCRKAQLENERAQYKRLKAKFESK